MLKKLLVSLLSALLCMSVVAETESQLNGNQNETDVKIDENGDVFVAPLLYHITSDSTAEVKSDDSYIELESVVIPSEIRIGGHVYSVTSIGDYAFCYCDRLTSIEIPSSVTSIEDGVFSGCSGLTSINVATDNAIYSSENGVLYDKNRTKLICVPGGKKGKFVVPSGVTSIGYGAFSGCSGLTNIEIPFGITEIEYDVFSGCSGLTSIRIPSSVTNIKSDAFYRCSGLTNIEIPASVTNIGYGAFSDCSSLKNIKIPSSVTNIGKKAFYGCENLEIVIDNSKENVIVEENTFEGCKSVKFLK